MRCVYCHNPDTQRMQSGKSMTAEEVVQQVLRYRSFIRNGGVTISGGEPLAQQAFVESILFELKKHGLHTALDTSGCFGIRVRPTLLDMVDLVLLDIKSWTEEGYEKVTGRKMEPVIEFAQHLESIGKSVWIRFVLVPGLTDDEATVDGIASFVKTLSNVEMVEILPFHKYGESKYKELNLQYTLADTPVPTEEETEKVRDHFRSYGLKVR